MAATVRSLTTNTQAGTGLTFTVTTPAAGGTAAVAGDLLVAFQANDWFTLAALTTPSGGSTTWTQVTGANADAGSFSAHIKVWWGVANASGALTVTFSETGVAGDEEKFAGVFIISGADTTTPIDGAAGSFSATTQTTQAATGISPAGSNALLLACWASGAGAATNSYTLSGGSIVESTEVHIGTTSGISGVFGTEALSASGATGTRTATAAEVVQWAASIVGIAAAAGGGGSSTNPRPPIVVSNPGPGDPRLRTRLTLSGQAAQVNAIKFAAAADAAARQIPRIPVTVVTAQPPAIRRAGGATVPERAPVPQVAYQGGTSALGLAGTGNQVGSVLRSSQVILATAPRHRSWTAPNAVGLVKPVAQPAVTATPELGTAALGLATTGNAVKVGVETGSSALGLAATGAAQKVAVVGGSCALGGATTGTGKKVASDAGSAALGLAGTGVEKKVAGTAGLDTAGLSATGAGEKVTVAAGRSAFGAIGTDSGTVVRAVNGTAGLGFAATGLSARKALPAGIAALGVASRGTEQHVAVQGGAGGLGAIGRGLPQHVAGAGGRAAFALAAAGEGIKSATQTGRVAAGFVQTADRTPIVAGAVHAGTVTDLADRLHVGALADLADRDTAGTVTDVATRYHAGVPT